MDELVVINQFFEFFLAATPETFSLVWADMGEHLWRRWNENKRDVRKFWADLDVWNRRALTRHLYKQEEK